MLKILSETTGGNLTADLVQFLFVFVARANQKEKLASKGNFLFMNGRKQR